LPTAPTHGRDARDRDAARPILGRLAPWLGALLAVVLVAPAAAQAQEGDLDDLMGGFDDGFDESVFEDTEESTPAWLEALPGGPWAWENVDVSGSIAAGAVWAYLSHTASDGLGGTTDYGGLSRLDLDGFLQVDVSLPYEWAFRGELLGWYDFAYLINGRSDYNGAVLDVYEWQVDSGELYVEGPVSEDFDLAVGRRIVNWGRSDTFRVVDVVNPLDNKEPGLVDIEDLRRPVAMVKIYYQSGPWSAQLLTIVEHRYDRLPPPGSEFIPDVFAGPGLGGGGLAGGAPIRDRSDWDRTPGFAAKADGRFSGWDFSIYGAWLEQTQRVIDLEGAGVRAEANRIGMAGAAGNVTRGPVLLKAEMAFLSGVRTLRFEIPPLAIPGNLLTQERERLDTMVGIEYYGPDQLTIALDVVNRHLFDHPGGPPNRLELTPQDSFETALRVTRPFFRERLDVTLLGLAAGERFQDGGLFRASAEYEVTDSIKLEGGWLVFFGGPRIGLGAFDSNDRVYGEVKYSF
jgi:hypothetical protein